MRCGLSRIERADREPHAGVRTIVGCRQTPALGREKLLAVIDGAVRERALRFAADARIADFQSAIKISDSDAIVAQRFVELAADIADQRHDVKRATAAIPAAIQRRETDPAAEQSTPDTPHAASPMGSS